MGEDARIVSDAAEDQESEKDQAEEAEASPGGSHPRYDRLPTWVEEPDELEGDDDYDDEVRATDAVSRVGAIISQATDQLGESPLPDQVDYAEIPSPSRGGRGQARARPMGTGAERAPHRGAEIAQALLLAPRCPEDVRSYASRRGHGRVPDCLVDFQEELEDEQQYIESLAEPLEAPERYVRLLASSEKDLLIRGLKQQFARATASFLKVAAKSRSRAKLEEELSRIRQDIDNLSRPYIFVEAMST
ncbi:unnamed protein product [Polarella glacialis]|uniref:Enkurin domain-containing protein n=1 Tax=Polarella glacialis TaxID=89957 RepID=A0A813JUZ4_POLGL|nr:unnamed protein product [Polarella glacialis]